MEFSSLYIELAFSRQNIFHVLGFALALQIKRLRNRCVGVVDVQMSDGHVYYMDCIPVIVENSINTWLAVLSVCLCYQRLLENMHEMSKMPTSKES